MHEEAKDEDRNVAKNDDFFLVVLTARKLPVSAQTGVAATARKNKTEFFTQIIVVFLYAVA